MTDNLGSMSKASSIKPRKPNPSCENCAHAQSFHPRDAATHRRKCKAFGCDCKAFVKPKQPASA